MNCSSSFNPSNRVDKPPIEPPLPASEWWLKRKSRFLWLIILCSLLSTAQAQVVQEWVQRYNGPGNAFDFARSVAVDDSGNAYVTGISQGAGTFDDYLTIKYDPSGEAQWVQRYNGPANEFDDALALAVDDNSNVYVTGFSAGSGTFNDFATVKYNSAGIEQWVKRYDGPIHDFDNAVALAVDDSGNAYVTGSSPGSNFATEFATIKYDSAGNELWVARYGSPALAGDYPYAVAVDGAGNVRQWVRRYDGPGSGFDEPHAVATDTAGNVYVTGASMSVSLDFDYLTIKYDPSGDSLWVRRYNGPAGNATDNPTALVLDNSGNIYVTGYSVGNGSGTDFLTIKYDAAGLERWVARYNGPEDAEDFANAISVDASGNVYVTGRTGKFTEFDYTTLVYDSTGIQLWIQKYDGPANGYDEAFSIAVANDGSVFVTGGSDGPGTDQDYATIKYSTIPGTLPDAPMLVSPADNVVVTADSVVFVWQQSQPNVDIYWFELSTDSLFSSAFIDSSLADTTTTVTQLSNDQAYWWRVRAHNPAGWGPFSEAWNFSVIVPQIDSALSFLPLHIGNLWQYHYHYHTSCGTEHSSYRSVEVVGDTILPTGYVYRIVLSDLPPDSPVRYLRVDTTSANVYEYIGLEDCLVDSLLATEGSWFFPVNYCWWPTECVDVDTESVLGLSTIVKSFEMQFIFGADYDLAHGLGRIRYTTYEDGQCLPVLDSYFSDFVYARIDGEEYGTFVNVDETSILPPASFKLDQNYPNPFNPVTTFSFSIPHSSFTILSVYDLLGREVATLVNEKLEPGRYTRQWDAAGLSSGTYFYQLRAGKFVQVKKLVLLR